MEEPFCQVFLTQDKQISWNAYAPKKTRTYAKGLDGKWNKSLQSVARILCFSTRIVWFRLNIQSIDPLMVNG